MQIKYINKKAEKQFSSKYAREWRYPPPVKEKLKAFENALQNAETLNDIVCIPQYHFHKMKGSVRGEWSIYLGKKAGYRVTLIPCDEQGKYIKEGDILAVCKSIKIVEIMEVSNHYE